MCIRDSFWTVHDPEKAIVIQCKDTAAYDEIIVEVEHPDHDITLITRALASR